MSSVQLKYADYTTRVAEGEAHWVLRPGEKGSSIVKAVMAVRRVPSTREFIGIMLQGTTEAEHAEGLRWLESMPRGGWARTTLWQRKNFGRMITYEHLFGVRVDDPLERLAEEFAGLDLTTEVSA